MGIHSVMSTEAQTITVDLVVEMLKQVVNEHASRNRGHLAAVVWGGETSLDEIGFDSFDFVEMIFKIEDHFNIEIDYNANNSINDVKTIAELSREIGKLVAAKQAV